MLLNLWAPSRTLSTGRNCSPAAATAVTPTSPPSTTTTSTLHHWCFRCIALFSSPRSFCLGPAPGEPGRRTCSLHQHVDNGQILRTSLCLWHLTLRFRRGEQP